MRWIRDPKPRRAALLALGAANILLLTAICMRPSVRAQQRPLQPNAPGYVAPAKPSAPPAVAPAAPAAAATSSTAEPTQRITLPPPPPRIIVVLDPARGGPDNGAQINDHLAEKDVTLAFAARLRATLQSHNFTIITTRDSDPTAGLTANQRAEIANHASAIACLVLHATATGNGVHLFTSALAPAERHGILPWATAQAAFAQQSAALQRELNTAFTHAQIATVNAQADVAPLDNLTCPAVAVEIAPYLAADATNTIDVSDPDYEQHVAETIATALVFWRGHQSVPSTGPSSGVAP
jgi:N-acetylmuramoyl-L-alanine amidase